MSRRNTRACGSSRNVKKRRCAVYTRKSTEEGLDKEFNTLDAQRDACEAYVASQRAEGWVLVPGPLRRRRLLGRHPRPPRAEAAAGRHRGRANRLIVVYKIDRLSRSLMDFAKLVEAFDRHNVTFVSVTQSFNTDDLHGPADAEHPALLRPVRARGDRRAHPGQVRRLPGARHVDGWHCAARLRRARPQARGERGRGIGRQADLRGFRGDRLGHEAEEGAAIRRV